MAVSSAHNMHSDRLTVIVVIQFPSRRNAQAIIITVVY